MAKVKPPKKKKPKSVGNPVTNPRGKLGQTLVTWVAARALTPALSHVASLPSRLGVGFDGEEDLTQPSSKRATRKGLQLDSPPTPPPVVHHPTINPRVPPPPPGPKKVIEPPPVASQVPPPKPEQRAQPGPSKWKAVGRAAGKAALYGGIGNHIGGPFLGVPAAMYGALKGTKPKDKSWSEHLGGAVGSAAKWYGKNYQDMARVTDDVVRDALAKHTPVKKLAQGLISGIENTVGKTQLGQKIGNTRIGSGRSIRGVAHNIADNLTFDNKELISPSSCRTTNTNKLSPGRALMTSIRMANENRQSSINNALQKAAFEALRNRKVDAALDLVDLYKEEPVDTEDNGNTNQLAANVLQNRIASRGGVALPSQEHGTRRNRADEGAMRASMDQLREISQGTTPQNPIGMDADECLAMIPSSRRATPLPLSPGQRVLKELREQKVMKQRMERAMNPLPEGFSNQPSDNSDSGETKKPSKWYVSGLVYTGPGRSHFQKLGPFNSEDEAYDAWGYSQGHPHTQEVEEPEE